MKLPKKDRANYFWLKAVDTYFTPKESHNLNQFSLAHKVKLHDDEGAAVNFIEQVEPGKLGYFLIGVSQTWPYFIQNQYKILSIIKRLKPNFSIVLVYVQEAMAKDTWPGGYQISTTTSVN